MADPRQLIREVEVRPAIWSLTEGHVVCRRVAWIDICKIFYPEFSNAPVDIKDSIWSALRRQWGQLYTEFFEEFCLRVFGNHLQGIGWQPRFPFYEQMEFLMNEHNGFGGGSTSSSVGSNSSFSGAGYGCSGSCVYSARPSVGHGSAYARGVLMPESDLRRARYEYNRAQEDQFLFSLFLSYDETPEASNRDLQAKIMKLIRRFKYEFGYFPSIVPCDTFELVWNA